MSKRQTQNVLFFVFLMSATTWMHHQHLPDSYVNESLISPILDEIRTFDEHTIIIPKPSKDDNKTAAICVIAKDEEPYIDEWVEYNLALGFDSIYIYDNSANFTLSDRWKTVDNTTGRLRLPPHLASKITVRHFPNTWQQRASYKDCIVRYGHKHEWMAFIDVDEFLVLKKHDHIVDMLQQHCVNGSLSINWFSFGTSNHTNYEPKPTTYRFRYRHPHAIEIHKIILRTIDYDHKHEKQKRGLISPHYALLVSNTYQRDTSGRNTVGFASQGGPTDVAVLHHYIFKSESEWKHKWCVRGNVAGFFTKCKEKTWPGSFFDDSAWRFLKDRVPKYRAFDS